jgi:hypothetical protein
MDDKTKIPASDEVWDEGGLGTDEKFVKVAEEDLEKRVDESLGLQLISIRLQKSLIDDFKYIAELNNIGYQTLMRQILQRFADGEKNRILREKACDAKQERLRLQEQQRARGSSQGKKAA